MENKENKKEKKVVNKSGRVFSASLKPLLSVGMIQDIFNKLNGVATVWAITHDKDVNIDGEKVEAHTHILIDYKTPRKISTVANLLGVEMNFIEIVRNKVGMLRYLTHLDDVDKYQYEASEVLTNDKIDYATTVMSGGLSNADIVDYIKQGRGLELIDVVSPSKLRAIQSFLHFDNSNILLNEIRAIKKQNDEIKEILDDVGQIANAFLNGIKYSAEELSAGMQAIAHQLNRSNNLISANKRVRKK